MPLQTPVAPLLNNHPRDPDRRKLDRSLVERVRQMRRSRGRQSPSAKHDDQTLLLIASASGDQGIDGVTERRGGSRQSVGGSDSREGRTPTFGRVVLGLPPGPSRYGP